LLRRALGSKRPQTEVEKLREMFIAGATANDVLPEIAESVFESLKAFGGYSFPKSHAAAFAVLVYQSAWLKHYWPAQLAVSLLNNQPMGFWTPAVIVNDARRHGIRLKRIDINQSIGNCTVEDDDIRIGFRYISGMGDASTQKIENARQSGVFRDLADFYRRVKLPRRITENLILVGAFDEWGIERRKLLWEYGRIGDYDGGLGLIFPDDNVKLRPLSATELLILETQVMGLTTGEHIMTFFQDWMRKKHVLGSRELETAKQGQIVQVAGETVMHQAPPTAKGYHFITLEDKDGMMNVIVRPSVYKQFRYVLRHAPLLWVKGKLQREGDITNVLCEHAANLPRVDS
jgi:error-prone DNA polymerase